MFNIITSHNSMASFISCLLSIMINYCPLFLPRGFLQPLKLVISLFLKQTTCQSHILYCCQLVILCCIIPNVVDCQWSTVSSASANISHSTQQQWLTMATMCKSLTPKVSAVNSLTPLPQANSYYIWHGTFFCILKLLPKFQAHGSISTSWWDIAATNRHILYYTDYYTQHINSAIKGCIQTYNNYDFSTETRTSLIV